jgi:NADH dehydrogenase
MAPLSITILGGTGFVGSRLASRLIREGHGVKVLTRNRDRHRALLVLPGLQLLDADVHDPRVLGEAVRGADAVVNLVGILNERGRATFARVHVELARKLALACRSAGVTRLVQLSSLGAAEQAPSRYLRSKAAAEQVLREDATGVWLTVLKPSLIIGAGGVVEQFAGLLRGLPLLPLARGGTRFAPVALDDVVEAIVRSLASTTPGVASFELCGPEVVTLADLVRAIGAAAGRTRPVIGVPDALGWLQAAVLGLVPGSPLTLDNFRSLAVESVCQDGGCARLGITPTSIHSLLPALVGAGQQNARFDQYRRSAGSRIGGP